MPIDKDDLDAITSAFMHFQNVVIDNATDAEDTLDRARIAAILGVAGYIHIFLLQHPEATEDDVLARVCHIADIALSAPRSENNMTVAGVA